MSDFFKGTRFAGWSGVQEIVKIARTFTIEEFGDKLLNGSLDRNEHPSWLFDRDNADLIAQVSEMKEILSKAKWFKPEEVKRYKIDGWGYDQTNYENLELIGEQGSYYIGCVNGYNFYKVPKSVEGRGNKRKDGSVKPYYKIDEVRTTHWQEPYSSKAIMDNRTFNMYAGH